MSSSKIFSVGSVLAPSSSPGGATGRLGGSFRSLRSVPSQHHAPVARIRQVDVNHQVLGGVEGDAGHLLLAVVLPVVDGLQGSTPQAVLHPLQAVAAGVEPGQVLDLLLVERVAGTIGAHEFLGEGLELFRVFAQREHGLVAIFVPGVCAVLQGIDPANAGLAAGLRGPVECRALERAAASKAGVSSGDFRIDIVPPCRG